MEHIARQMTWSPWKMATIGIAVVITTALLTGLVVGNWAGIPGDGIEVSRIAPAVSGGTVRNEIGVRSNRAVSRSNSTTDVLQKAVIGGATGAGGGARGDRGAGNGAAIGGIAGATSGTPDSLQDK